MAFNALISNTDDHPRNHALIAPTEKWERSPAYDQTRALIDQMQRVVSARWLPVLRQHGASDADCDRLAPAFNYPGFELGPADVLSAGA